jgi:bifunctional non-homologous end joining protein LigD
MKLSNYNEKRKFNTTKEPVGRVGRSVRGDHIFVVQKHKARSLHYDFRLEMEGVLKSWAVPKGPSLNSTHRRLAIAVEDHPYSYKDFEGTIEKDNYGAGTVIIWDRGIYTLPSAMNHESVEKIMQNGYKKGQLDFVLDGKKLCGGFSLFKMKRKNLWLLAKKKDKYDSKEDVTKQNKSVVSNKEL